MAGPCLADRQVVSGLHCPVCGGERPHQVYLDHEGVTETVCSGCGRVVSLPQRRSARVPFGPYTIGGGAPLLVCGRVPGEVTGGALARAVRELIAAGAHGVELDAEQAQDAIVRRLAREIPVALVVDVGDRLADAYRFLSHAQAGRTGATGGWAAVRWTYDGHEGHLSFVLAAAAQRQVPLVLAVPLRLGRVDGFLNALARGATGLEPVIVEFCGEEPAELLAAYQQAAAQLRSPFYGRFPHGWLAGEEARGQSAALGSFLRQRLCDGLGVTEAKGGPDAVRAACRMLSDLWLPVAAPPPRVQVSIAGGQRAGWPVPAPVLGTVRSAAGVSGRVVRGLRSPAVGQLPSRVFTKPFRLWHEVRRDGPGVLWSMPRRMATKPVRLVRQLGREVRERS